MTAPGSIPSGTQADAYGGYNGLSDPSRPAGAITPAFCWAHARRRFFELADIAASARRGKNAAVISPIALEAVTRIDALFEIERVLNGRSASERLAARKEQSAPLVSDLEVWLRDQRTRLSRSAAVAEPIDYLLKRWPSFTRFLDETNLFLEQRRRARPAGLCPGSPVLALRRLRARRRTGRERRHANHDGQIERR